MRLPLFRRPAHTVRGKRLHRQVPGANPALNPRVGAVRPAGRTAAAKGREGFPDPKGIFEAARGGGSGQGDCARGRGVAEVLEGEEGEGGGGLEEKDGSGSDRNTGRVLV